MGDLFKAKIRPLGSSACVLIPKELLKKEGLVLGDQVKIALVRQKKDFSGFGIAKYFKVPFTRDKKTREFT